LLATGLDVVERLVGTETTSAEVLPGGPLVLFRTQAVSFEIALHLGLASLRLEFVERLVFIFCLAAFFLLRECFVGLAEPTETYSSPSNTLSSLATDPISPRSYLSTSTKTVSTDVSSGLKRRYTSRCYACSGSNPWGSGEP
jgi:hypothetical protein